MGSTSDIKECSQCGGLLHTEYWYRTGEFDDYCIKCGYSQFGHIKIDNQSKWVRKDVEYPLDGLTVLGIRNENKLIWELPIKPDLPESEIADFINAYSFNNHNTVPDWVKPLIHMEGHKCIFRKENDGGITQLMYTGTWFRFQTSKDGKVRFYIEEAVWDFGTLLGNGVFSIAVTETCRKIFSVNNMTKDEVLKFLKAIKKEKRLFDTSSDYITFREPKTGELVCLYGKMPAGYDECIDDPKSESA